MAKIKIDHYVVGPVQTNCYFLVNAETNEMLCIDPGASAAQLAERVGTGGYRPKAVLLTHGHFDHASAARAFADTFQIPIYIHEAEEETLKDPELNASWMMGRRQTYSADVFVKDGQELNLAGLDIRVLYTPGHTPGGCCYYLPEQKVVFTGDSLFCQSIGRTDFKKGSMSQLVNAVKNKLMTLPEETVVYPGHNDITSIADEKIYNPYL